MELVDKTNLNLNTALNFSDTKFGINNQIDAAIDDCDFSTIQSAKFDYLVLNSHIKLEIIKFTDITFIEADGPYSILKVNDRSFKISKNLKHFDFLLSNPCFTKLSRSVIVNVLKIKRIESKNQSVNNQEKCLVFANGETRQLKSKSIQKRLTDYFDVVFHTI